MFLTKFLRLYLSVSGEASSDPSFIGSSLLSVLVLDDDVCSSFVFNVLTKSNVDVYVDPMHHHMGDH